MIIIGADYHPGFQQIAFVDTDTGELQLRHTMNVAAGFALAWVMGVCAMLCFAVVGHYLGGVFLCVAAYAACFALGYFVIARLHFRAARSASLRDAQRKLYLLPARTL